MQLWKVKALSGEPIATVPPMWLKKSIVGGAPGAVKPSEATLMTIVWIALLGLCQRRTVALISSALPGSPGEVESAPNVTIVIGAAAILRAYNGGIGIKSNSTVHRSTTVDRIESCRSACAMGAAITIKKAPIGPMSFVIFIVLIIFRRRAFSLRRPSLCNPWAIR